MKKWLTLCISACVCICSLLASGTNPSAGSSRGGTNPASTAYVSNAKYKIGDFAEGGVVIWLTRDGQHGLVAAIEDQVDPTVGIPWTPATFFNASITPNTNNCLPLEGSSYSGKENTDAIVTYYSQLGASITSYAAGLAANYSFSDGSKTYSDWFLPSTRELDLMYALVDTINSVSQAHGGSSMTIVRFYWSSRENVDSNAWFLFFADGLQTVNFKFNSGAVRCVRAF